MPLAQTAAMNLRQQFETFAKCWEPLMDNLTTPSLMPDDGSWGAACCMDQVKHW
jgi:hypothetical protein